MSASTKRKERQAAREAGVDKKQLAAQREAELKAKSRTRWTLGGVAVVLLIAVILFLNSGFLYTRTTALTIGDDSYTPAEFSYQYANQYYNLVNQYGNYTSLIGLDTSLPRCYCCKNRTCNRTSKHNLSLMLVYELRAFFN